MIERYHYWARPLSLRRMMDELFANAYVMPRSAEVPQSSGHTLNAYEEGDHLVLEAHLPGFKPEDINLAVEQGILTIRAQARADEERKERSYVVREHRANSFVRSLRLPETVDVDAATATYGHGVLRLTFPNTAPARPRRVPIAVSDQGALGSTPSEQPRVVTSESSLEPSIAATTPSDGAASKGTSSNGTATGEAPEPTAPAVTSAAQLPKSAPSGSRAPRRKMRDVKTAAEKGSGRKATAKKEPAGAGA